MKDVVKRENTNADHMKSSIKQRGRPKITHKNEDQNKPEKQYLKQHDKPQLKENNLDDILNSDLPTDLNTLTYTNTRNNNQIKDFNDSVDDAFSDLESFNLDSDLKSNKNNPSKKQ